MMHLVFPYYRPDDSDRCQRINQSLRENLSLGWIEKVTLLSDCDDISIEDSRIHVRMIGRRARFGDYLDIVSNAAGSSEDCIVLCNSDIILPENLPNVANRIVLPSTAIALTRREMDGEYPRVPHPSLSQDVWMMRPQQLDELLIQSAHFQLGIAGCENLFAALLVSHSFNLWNPCEDIKPVHYDPRPNTDYINCVRYHGIYVYPMPCLLGSVEVDNPIYRIAMYTPLYSLNLGPA